MIDNSDKQTLLMGLPLSGKSTFIGALWHILVSNEKVSSFEFLAEPEDREYLNMLRDAWLRCKAPERTSSQLFKFVEFKIRQLESHTQYNFVFPDVSGELYESQFEHRRLTQDYFNVVEKCDGIMLFINPMKITESNLITDVDAVDSALEEFFGKIAAGTKKNIISENENIAVQNLASERATGDNEKKNEIIEWKHKYSQTQVIIIDLLQMIKKYVRKPCKIALIISAWDIIYDRGQVLNAEKKTPMQWFKERIPLLEQFFISNGDIFKFEVFGVSAQGGSYEEDKVTALHDIDLQSNRAYIQLGESRIDDITVPIKWLLDE